MIRNSCDIDNRILSNNLFVLNGNIGVISMCYGLDAFGLIILPSALDYRNFLAIEEANQFVAI